MHCRDLEKHLEGWLRDAPAAELREHLKGCPACRARAEELARTAAWLPWLREEPPVPGPAFWGRLRGRLEEQERGGEFWESLSWTAARAVLALAVLVLLLTLSLLRESTSLAVQDFDNPRAYLDDAAATALANGQINRDQVVTTLVAYREPGQ